MLKRFDMADSKPIKTLMALLVFVKPTEILWWIIHKRTDTGEHSTRERVLNIELTGRMVKRVSEIYN
jgi:hypothetical protein